VRQVRRLVVGGTTTLTLGALRRWATVRRSRSMMTSFEDTRAPAAGEGDRTGTGPVSPLAPRQAMATTDARRINAHPKPCLLASTTLPMSRSIPADAAHVCSRKGLVLPDKPLYASRSAESDRQR
jgi:hypothetical protein